MIKVFKTLACVIGALMALNENPNVEINIAGLTIVTLIALPYVEKNEKRTLRRKKQEAARAQSCLLRKEA